MSEIHLAKAASIQRSVARARQECAAAGERFSEDLTRQDAAVMNVLRACETAIDLANALVRERQLGIPQSNRDSFRLLADAAVIFATSRSACRRWSVFETWQCTLIAIWTWPSSSASSGTTLRICRVSPRALPVTRSPPRLW